VLRDAAGVDAAMGGFGGLNAAMICAAGALLRAWGGFRRRLLMLRGWRLLMLLPLLRSAVVIALVTVLRVDRSDGSEEQERGSGADC